MKVLHLISSLGFFGAEQVMVNIAQETFSLGIDTFVGVIENEYNPHVEVAQKAEERGIKTHLFPCRFRFDIMTILRIRKYMKNNKIDILHSHGYKSNIYGKIASIFTGIKVVSTCHNRIQNTRKMRVYVRLDITCLKWADRLVVVSKTVMKKLIDAGIAGDKVSVVYNGVNTKLFEDSSPSKEIREELGISENDIVIGTIGRLSAEKGVQYLLKAFAGIIEEFPNTRLLIVGGGLFRDELMSTAKGLEVEKRVIFTGVRDDVPEVLKLFSIFILPSLNEGLPMVILEAMAAGKPIISTRVGAIPDIIGPDKTGVLIKPESADEIREAIVKLLRDKKKMDFLRKNALDKVRGELTSRIMAGKYIEIYRAL